LIVPETKVSSIFYRSGVHFGLTFAAIPPPNLPPLTPPRWAILEHANSVKGRRIVREERARIGRDSTAGIKDQSKTSENYSAPISRLIRHPFI
jgi:hypothetical protein